MENMDKVFEDMSYNECAAVIGILTDIAASITDKMLECHASCVADSGRFYGLRDAYGVVDSVRWLGHAALSKKIDNMETFYLNNY